LYSLILDEISLDFNEAPLLPYYCSSGNFNSLKCANDVTYRMLTSYQLHRQNVLQTRNQPNFGGGVTRKFGGKKLGASPTYSCL